MYESKFLTFLVPDESTTSSRLEGASTGPRGQIDDDELLRQVRDVANGETYARLWRGDTSRYESHSEAYMALCTLLAFWTGGYPRQMDRLFRDYTLKHGKWDETHFANGSTYSEKTIESTISGADKFYEPPSGKDDYCEETRSSRDSDRCQRVDGQLGRNDEVRQQLAYVLKGKDWLRQELGHD